MALVARRVLQRILDENAHLLTPEQHQKHVQSLNSDKSPALATEYEVLILHALSGLGRVQHEPKLTGSRRPDVLFEIATDPPQRFVADVTTVSDSAAHDENPYDDFSKELGKLLKDSGLTGAGFDIKVDGTLTGPAEKQKMVLSLPRKGDLRRIVRRELGDFVRTVKANRDQPTTARLSGFDARVSYDPRKSLSTGGHPSYTTPYSLENNPIANALRSKVSQLKGTGFDGALGIILCDGSCNALHSLPVKSGGWRPHHSVSDIVTRFFRFNRSVSFVCILTVPQPYPSHTPARYSFYSELFINSKARHSCTPEQRAALAAMVDRLPAPRRTPANALHALNSKSGIYTARYGGWHVQSHEIKLSTRALLQLLSGRVDPETFLRDHRLSSSQPNGVPFFEAQLKAGRMITAARVERCPDDDDDWILLKFGDPDPALAPLR